MEQLPFILTILKETNAFSATREKARDQVRIAKEALAFVPNLPYRKALENLLVFAVERNS